MKDNLDVVTIDPVNCDIIDYWLLIVDWLFIAYLYFNKY